MLLEILTEIFPQKESNYSLGISTTLQGRSIKNVMDGSKTISSLLWGILTTELKKFVSPARYKKTTTTTTKKIVNVLQRIAHVFYIKHMNKTLDFCKLPVRTYFAL